MSHFEVKVRVIVVGDYRQTINTYSNRCIESDVAEKVDCGYRVTRTTDNVAAMSHFKVNVCVIVVGDYRQTINAYSNRCIASDIAEKVDCGYRVTTTRRYADLMSHFEVKVRVIVVGDYRQTINAYSNRCIESDIAC